MESIRIQSDDGLFYTVSLTDYDGVIVHEADETSGSETGDMAYVPILGDDGSIYRWSLETRDGGVWSVVMISPDQDEAPYFADLELSGSWYRAKVELSPTADGEQIPLLYTESVPEPITAEIEVTIGGLGIDSEASVAVAVTIPVSTGLTTSDITTSAPVGISIGADLQEVGKTITVSVSVSSQITGDTQAASLASLDATAEISVSFSTELPQVQSDSEAAVSIVASVPGQLEVANFDSEAAVAISSNLTADTHRSSASSSEVAVEIASVLTVDTYIPRFTQFNSTSLEAQNMDVSISATLQPPVLIIRTVSTRVAQSKGVRSNSRLASRRFAIYAKSGTPVLLKWTEWPNGQSVDPTTGASVGSLSVQKVCSTNGVAHFPKMPSVIASKISEIESGNCIIELPLGLYRIDSPGGTSLATGDVVDIVGLNAANRLSEGDEATSSEISADELENLVFHIDGVDYTQKKVSEQTLQGLDAIAANGVRTTRSYLLERV